MSRLGLALITGAALAGAGAPALCATRADICKLPETQRRAALVDALLADSQLPPTFAELVTPSKLGEDVVAGQTCSGSEPRCTALKTAYDKASNLVRGAGEITLLWKAGRDPEPVAGASPSGEGALGATVHGFKNINEKIRKLLNPSADVFVVDCSSFVPPPAPDTQPQTVANAEGFHWPKFKVGDDPEAADPDAVADKKPATLAYVSDRTASGSDVFSLKAAVVWPDLIGRKTIKTQADVVRVSQTPVLSAFVAVNEVSNKVQAKKTDDVSVGTFFSGDLAPGQHYVLSASWVTDVARRDSSLVHFEAKFRPTLPLYAYDHYPSTKPGGFSILPLWRVAIVADYADVQAVGHKVSLAKVDQYGRIGYDVDASLRFGRSEAEPSVTLSAGYKLRDELSHRRADAHLLDVGLTYVPKDDSPYSFGFTWERGKVIDTLAETDLLKATIGFKR